MKISKEDQNKIDLINNGCKKTFVDSEFLKEFRDKLNWNNISIHQKTNI